MNVTIDKQLLDALIQAARLGQMFVQDAVFKQEDDSDHSPYIDGYPKRAYDDIDSVIQKVQLNEQ